MHTSMGGSAGAADDFSREIEKDQDLLQEKKRELERLDRERERLEGEVEEIKSGMEEAQRKLEEAKRELEETAGDNKKGGKHGGGFPFQF